MTGSSGNMMLYHVNSKETNFVKFVHDNQEDHIPKHHWEKGEFYEYQALKFLQMYLPHPKIVKKGIILDIGANVGNHTIFWAMQGHTVVPFEPNPRANVLLKENVTRNKLEDNVKLELSNYGVSDQERQVEIIDNMKQNLGGAQIKQSNSGNIQTIRLDKIDFKQCIDFVKIDVEGHELNVLRGAKKTIAKHRPIIYCETTVTTRKDVEDLLKESLYSIEARHRMYSGVYNILAIPD